MLHPVIAIYTYNELLAGVNRKPERSEHEAVHFRIGDVHPFEGAFHLPIDRSNLILELFPSLGIEENVVAGHILILVVGLIVKLSQLEPRLESHFLTHFLLN